MCRILVIEDDRVQQRLLSDVLSEEHHDVTVVGSMAAAMPELRQQIDLIVTDLFLQGALVSIEEIQSVSTATILVLSGHEELQAITRAAGVASLAKPYDIDELLKLVDALCPSPAAALA